MLGKYRVLGRLGKGGMGVVYRAHDPDLDREVAIKVLGDRETRHADALTRFAREARALARITDPHVVHVYEFQAGVPQAWLVMELVNGISLGQLIAAQGSRPLRQVLDCGWQVLHGLCAAHAAGVLHRDLKPSNVLLAPGGVWKLIDFGLAWLTAAEEDADRVTRPGLVVGTARYLAPEIARGGEPTAASDLFALGMTLVEMALGRHPRGNDGNQLAQLQAAALGALPGAAQLLPDAPPAVQAWFDRLLAADPAVRFADAAAALAALPRPDAFTDPAASTGTMSTVGTPPPAPGQATGSVVLATHRPPTTTLGRQHGRRVPWRPPFLLRLTLAIWVVASASTSVAGWAISRQAVATQTERLREQIRGLAASASMLIDGDAHARLIAAAAPVYAAQRPGSEAEAATTATATAVMRQPEWVALRDRLRAFQRLHPELRFVYTMAETPDTAGGRAVMFVCDASERLDLNRNGVIDRDEEQALPGTPYPAVDAPELIAGFRQSGADHELTSDQWGSYLSGYAPIHTADGAYAGLVGVDVPADHITRLARDFLWHSVILLISTLLAFLAAALLIARRMSRPVDALRVGLARVAGGDYRAQVEAGGSGEFALLAASFNQMAARLRDGDALRAAYDRLLARTLGRGTAVVEGPCAVLHAEFTGHADTLAGDVAGFAAAVRAHGGQVERIAGRGLSAVFPAQAPGDAPQERAVRAALAAAAADLHPMAVYGVSAGSDLARAEREAAALAAANRSAGTDLLVEPGCFAAIAHGFYADRILLTLGPAVAVKGPVSG
jgi:serine/threonine-protein kinase